MGRWQTIVVGVALVSVAMAAEPRSRPARISLELFTDQGLGIDTQRWYQTLTDLGVSNLRIRGAETGDEIGIQVVGKRESPTYEVKGRIGAGNVLLLPGGKFAMRDAARLKQWLKNLTDQGVDGVTGKPARFGLTELQLGEVQDDLKRPVGFSTLGLTADEAVTKIAGGLKHPLEFDRGAREALAKRQVAENLEGLSAGTVLALILRPAGLVFVPQRLDGKTTRYRVESPAAEHDAWPAGWTSEKPDRELVPDLFKFILVEIDDTPVAEATAAIQKRLEIPFLWDHYALEAQASDPAEVVVKLPAKKLPYVLIVQKLLSQAKLQKELRIDEAGKPFLWITTLLPVPLEAKSEVPR